TSAALRFMSGTISSVFRTDFTPSTPFVISSAATRSSGEATLPRRVTTPLCVSTLIWRALVRLSATSFIFVLEVIQESLTPIPPPCESAAGAGVVAGVVADCAALTTGYANSAVNSKRGAILMDGPPGGQIPKGVPIPAAGHP